MKKPRGLAADSTTLAIGSVVNGITAYAFIALGTRVYGATAFEPVSVLWSLWTIAIALLTFPLQHASIRSLRLDPSGVGLRAAMKQVTLITIAVATAGSGIAFLVRNELFGSATLVYPTIVLLVVLGSGFLGLVRGVLAGGGRFTAAAVALSGENIVRFVAAGAVVLFGLGVEMFAAALAVGPAIALLWPRSLVRHLLRGRPVRTDRDRTVQLVGTTGIAVLMAQALLTGAPIVLALMDAPAAAVTSVFVALSVFRAPYLFALGVALRLMAWFSDLVLDGRLARLRRFAWTVLGWSLLASIVFAVGAAYLALPALKLAFGPGIHLPGLHLGALAAGSVLAVGSLITTLLLLARGRAVSLVAAWGMAVVVSAVVLISTSRAPLTAVTWAFLAGEASAITLLTGLSLRPTGGTESGAIEGDRG